MTNYDDLPCVSLVQHETGRYVFNKEKSYEISQHLAQVIIGIIKQCGFEEYDPQCIFLLRTCLIDFYQDLLVRFKQRLDSLGSSITMQDVFERTLNDVMSINLNELQCYMRNKTYSM